MPEYSIIMPIHNQETIINKVLQKIFLNTVGYYEVILLLDGCTDNSKAEVLNTFKQIPDSITNVLIFEFKSSRFETSCDNFGFKLAKSEYLIEIQADIYIHTYGYNYLLSRPFRKYDDVLSVSGRCAHGLTNWGIHVGKCNVDVEQPITLGFEDYDTFFVLETNNRGPWMLSKSKLEEIGYLDENNFVLGGDEHDINMRGNVLYNWVCGYVPIEVHCNLHEGTTRKQRSVKDTEILITRESKSDGGFLKKVKDGSIKYNTKGIVRRTL